MKESIPKKKSVLVIEDERALLEVVSSRLEKKGFKVMTARSVDEVFNATLDKNGLRIISASSIQQALDYLDDLENVDAIWLDHNLVGKENGLSFVKKLKANGATWKNIPVFVVSNTEKSEIVNSYMDLGVSKYYIKSNHKLDEIIADINAFIENPKLYS